MMLFIYDELGYSFRKVMSLVEVGMRRIGYKTVYKVGGHTALLVPKSNKAVLITDTVLAVRWGWIRRFAWTTDKLCMWTDTPLSLEHIEPDRDFINENACNYATLPFFCEKFEKHGVTCHGWIPRPIDIYTANEVYREPCDDVVKRYGDYVITVGGDQILNPPRIPRKGLDAFDQLCAEIKSRRNIRCVAVTNWPLRNTIRVPFGSLDERQLLKLIKCAKLFVWTSRSEGFGMPPVEAMAVGQLVVASNAPFNEHIIGVKFDYEGEQKVFMPEIGYNYDAYIYRLRDLIDTVDYALDLPEDERARIADKARNASQYYEPALVASAINEV